MFAAKTKKKNLSAAEKYEIAKKQNAARKNK